MSIDEIIESLKQIMLAINPETQEALHAATFAALVAAEDARRVARGAVS